MKSAGTSIAAKMTRTHTNGQLRCGDVGQEVRLCGWVSGRRSLGSLIFLDLRDRYGLTQVVFDSANPNAVESFKLAEAVRSEYVVACAGRVRTRIQPNLKMPTGEIEVVCTDMVVLSQALTTPFVIADEVDANEVLRLKYRYLDLRRPVLQRNLVIRHRMLTIVRNHLDEHSFLEVETPVLYKSTPEGARDFVVPSRMNQGDFYALPQSPQTLKQLLMIAGMDRYFQVARCFRDEDLRADRQPEFSQIDIEASFIDENSLFPVLEAMMAKLWKTILGVELSLPFLRMPYKEAMDRFGSDKPDTRFGLELQDVSKVFESTVFKPFASALACSGDSKEFGSVRAIVVPQGADRYSRKDLDELSALAGTFGAKGLVWIKVQATGELQSPAAKFFTEAETKSLAKALDLKPGHLVLAVADSRNKVVFDSLGAIRLAVGQKLGLVPPLGQGAPHFLWVVDFPLLEFDPESKRYYACHHPFTAPKPEYFEDFVESKNLDHILASAYDLVLNGAEIGGGSLRIFRSDVQQAMFKILGLTEEEAKEKFGFFLEALQYGTPPHGGIALGVERLTAMLCGVGPIRDVMAFPKTQKGHCLMSDSPSKVSEEQLSDLGMALNLKSTMPAASTTTTSNSSSQSG